MSHPDPGRCDIDDAELTWDEICDDVERELAEEAELHNNPPMADGAAIKARILAMHAGGPSLFAEQRKEGDK